MIPGAAFYCASSDLYFPGAVALVNSLRLVGHTEPIYLLDCGLSAPHRRLLAREARIVEGGSGVSPHLLKTIAPLRHAAEVRVLIDVDMVVTRSLEALIAQAAEGKVVAVKDNLDRFVPEWGELLDLGPTRRRPYVSSGLVLAGEEAGDRALELWDDRQRRVDFTRSFFDRREEGYPFLYIDQDVLNAVLCTSVPEERIVTLEPALAPVPPFHRIRLVDERTLRCRDEDGIEPYVLHQFVRKPWIEPMYHSIYSRLLSRLWLGDDVPIRLAPDAVPRRMRAGLAAWAERRAVDAWDLTRWYVRDLLPERVNRLRNRERDAP